MFCLADVFIRSLKKTKITQLLFLGGEFGSGPIIAKNSSLPLLVVCD